MAKTPFFEGWRVAGVSIGFGVWYKFDNSSGLSAFQNITASDVSETKLKDDLDNIKNYSNQFIEYSYGENVTFPLRVVFKPKKIEHGNLKSYIELNLALLYSIQNFTTDIRGWQPISSTTTKSYGSSYSVETRNFAVDGLVTLQTPGIFSLFSFYSGIGAYAGGNFDNFVYSSTSVERVGSNRPFAADTVTTVIPSTNQFYLPATSLGFYVPVGLKLNISKHSNLYIEYTFSRRTLVFSNLHSKSFWYRGIGIGYRFKFATKPKKEKKPLGTPAKTPEPFY